MPRGKILLMVILGASIRPVVLQGQEVAAPAFPVQTLRNATLEADVYLPDPDAGFYRGIRFDRSSMIGEVRLGERRFFRPWRGTGNPTSHDGNASGPAEEFGMKDPPGFASAATGETFMKIGVGHLARANDKPYGFFRSYPLIDPGAWTVEKTDTAVTMTHTLAPRRGYGCTLKRTVRLADDGDALIVERTLTNTGSEPIDTDAYTHNFVIIDDIEAVGPDYAVQTRFPLKPVDVKFRDLAAAGEHAITMTRPLAKGQSIWGRFEGVDEAEQNAWSVTYRPTGSRLTLTMDQPTEAYAFYAQGKAFCPEPFIRIHVEPGASMTWTSRYSFGAAAE